MKLYKTVLIDKNNQPKKNQSFDPKMLFLAVCKGKVVRGFRARLQKKWWLPDLTDTAYKNFEVTNKDL